LAQITQVALIILTRFQLLSVSQAQEQPKLSFSMLNRVVNEIKFFRSELANFKKGNRHHISGTIFSPKLQEMTKQEDWVV